MGLTAVGKLPFGQIVWSQPPPVIVTEGSFRISGVDRMYSLIRATASAWDVRI